LASFSLPRTRAIGSTYTCIGAIKNMKSRITFTLVFSALLVVAPALVGLSTKSLAADLQNDAKKDARWYYCVMDPEVKSNKPGTCPKCGMTLRPAKEEAPSDSIANKNANENSDADAIKDYARPGAIPDTPIYDQDGQKLHFYSDLVKGKTVAINFIFTTCTTICPPLAATFRRIQVELGDRVDNDIRLISISVDPATDVPERLKAFAGKFKAGPGWTFVTGSKPDVDLLLKALGAAVGDKNDHTPMVLVGNEPAGYWTRSYGLAPPAVLVKVITDAASKGGARTTAQ
jgi:cytochrome oxidase Cu insertion factor (SCO1/SenC/PrrC family)